MQWAEKAVRLRLDQAGLRIRLAICLGHLDRGEQARAALLACERLQPGFLDSRRGWQPYSDAARNEHFVAGLERLGLLRRARDDASS